MPNWFNTTPQGPGISPNGPPDENPGVPGLNITTIGGRDFLIIPSEDGMSAPRIQELSKQKEDVGAGGRIQEKLGAYIQANNQAPSEAAKQEIINKELGISTKQNIGIQTDEKTGRRYLLNPNTGQFEWIDPAPATGSDSGFRSAMLPWTLGMTPAQEAELGLQREQLNQQGEQFGVTNQRLLEQMAQLSQQSLEGLQIQRDQLAEAVANNQRNYDVALAQAEEQKRQFNTISPFQQAQLDRMGQQLEEQKREFEISNKRLELEALRTYDLNLKVQRFNAAAQQNAQYGGMARGTPGFGSIDVFGG